MPARVDPAAIDADFTATEEAKVMASNHSPFKMVKGKQKTLDGAPLYKEPKPEPKRRLTRTELKALWNTREENA